VAAAVDVVAVVVVVPDRLMFIGTPTVFRPWSKKVIVPAHSCGSGAARIAAAWSNNTVHIEMVIYFNY
jgi:hypothetical protein